MEQPLSPGPSPYPHQFGLPHQLLVGEALAATVLALLLAPTLALTVPDGAWAHARIPAHAKLTRADPAPGAVLTTAPSTITLEFAEDLQPGSSNIVVFNVKGDKVSTGAASVDRSDLKTMTVHMQGNGSEVYVVV